MAERFAIALAAARGTARHALLSAALAGFGRPVIDADEETDAESVGADACLILVDLDGPGLDRLVPAIRASGGPGATVPILGVTERGGAVDGAPPPLGLDAVVRVPPTPEVLAAAVAAWLPDGDAVVGARLAVLFGDTEVDPLVASLREQLAAAIVELDAFGASQHAHRLAGLAGLLDLSDVHRAWLALSEGDDSARADARRVARVTVARIDRRRLSGGGRSTSV